MIFSKILFNNTALNKMTKFKKLLYTLEAPKIILTVASLILLFLILYEFLLIEQEGTVWSYKFGIIFSKLCYSILAASIFYGISQYLPVVIPRRKKRLRILHLVYLKADIIGSVVENMKHDLGINGEDLEVKIREDLKSVNPDHRIAQFINWYEYAAYIKNKILDLCNGIGPYNEYLPLNLTTELLLIQKALLSHSAFDARPMFATNDLTYGEIPIKEIIVHNAL